MLVVTSELQFPIADPLHGLFFLRGREYLELDADLDLGDLRKSIGFGSASRCPPWEGSASM